MWRGLSPVSFKCLGPRDGRRADRACRIWLWLEALLVGASTASAQAVSGRVLAKADGAPVAGAIVALVDSSGRAVATELAEDDGTFHLAAPSAGRFSVRVERVGFRSTVSAPLMLADGETRNLAIAITSENVTLREVRVNADRRCLVRPQEGMAAAQLWDEARKALSATQLNQLAQAAARSREAHRFLVRTRKTQRELEPTTLRATREEHVDLEGETITPFTSADPAKLDRDGYIDGTMESPTTYYAPDASILLSDRFLDTHCFRVEGGGRHRADLIGLAFEPTDRTRKIGRSMHRVDVTGVLWLDRASAELRYMEYHYVDLPVDVPNDAAGGQLEFRPLPDGRWVVWRWYIRMPRLQRHAEAFDPAVLGRVRPALQLVAIHEEGAEIVDVLPPGSRQIQLATVHGVVSDSLRGGPLGGVRVFLSGTSFAAVTSADGSYTIDTIPPGRYSVSILASRLDSLLLDPPVRDLLLSAGEDERVDFAVPSARALAQRLCPDVTATDSSSILVGVVRDTTDAAAPGARVRVEWNAFSKMASDRLVNRPVAAETKSAAGGRFALCGLPPNTRLTVQARRGGNSVAGPVLHFSPGEVRRVDLRLRAP